MDHTIAALDALPLDRVPAAIAHLSARLLAAPAASALTADEVLTPTQVAKLLHQPVRYVYRHARALGGIRMSKRKLIFRRADVERRLKGKQL